MNLLGQKWEALGREAVMRGVSRLEIANNMRVGRTFVRCVQIENALMIEDDEIGIGKDVFVPMRSFQKSEARVRGELY